MSYCSNAWDEIEQAYLEKKSILVLFTKINRILKYLCANKLFSLAKLKCGIGSDDILQELRLKIYETLVNLYATEESFPIENFKAYINSVIKNKLKDIYKNIDIILETDQRVKKYAPVSFCHDYSSFNELYLDLRNECAAKVDNGGLILDILFENGAYGVTEILKSQGLQDCGNRTFYKKIRRVKQLVKEYAYGKNYASKLKD